MQPRPRAETSSWFLPSVRIFISILLIQTFLLQKLRHEVGDLKLVEVRKREMCIAPDPHLGQMHDGDITAPVVYRIPPEPRHRQTDTPTILAGISGRLRRNV